MNKGFGELLFQSWKEYKKNFKMFFILILLFGIIPSFIIKMINFDVYYNAIANPEGFIFYTDPFPWPLVSSILYLILTSVLIYFMLYNKKGMTYGMAIKGGLKYFFRYFWLTLVFIVFVALLLLLLIIPGIIFFVYWIFSSYILIGENKGVMESLKRSKEIVKGRWWRVFGYTALLFLIFNVFVIVLFIPVFFWNSMLLDLIVTWITDLIYIPMITLFLKNFYLDLKKTSKK